MNIKFIYLLIPLLFHVQVGLCQNEIISGKVTSSDGTPIDGATILALPSNRTVVTSDNGTFSITRGDDTTINVSTIGFDAIVIDIKNVVIPLTIVLKENTSYLDEVIVTTGYQSIPKDRATGSFSTLNNDLINRSVSTDIISRMENVTSGLLFDNRFEGNDPLLSVRGQSTIQSNSAPLVIVDNFPYEGDLININPNDIENITVLKDAAAASIWGSRAGNGVIVITTKKGKLNKPLSFEINSNTMIGERPNLFHNQALLPADDFIEIERYLFEGGYYSSMENNSSYPVLSPVVELLIAARDNIISKDQMENEIISYKRNDLRKDLEKYFYRAPVNQQYSMNVNGGGEKSSYYLGAGLDRNRDAKVRDGLNRISLNAFTSFYPLRNFEISNSITYSLVTTKNNSGVIRQLNGPSARIYPYAQLADNSGNPLAVNKDYNNSFIDEAESNGLLNWQFYPLNELNNTDNKSKTQNIRINNAIAYTFLPGLNAEARYQYEHQTISDRELQSAELYSTRNMINQYAQPKGVGGYTFPIPHGDILDIQDRYLTAHSGRAQLNYNTSWNTVNHITALGGMEVRQAKTDGNRNRVYGYNDNLLTYTQVDYLTRFVTSPSGSSARITDNIYLIDLIDRNISYFGNASYSYKNKYTLTGSVRKDESNLFGVKSNQKGVPLWSAGFGWTVSSEKFYKANKAVPYLKLRTTYGYSGNINKSLTAYTTGSYSSSGLTGLPYIQIMTPPNDQLRWEKIRTINVGLDFSLKNNIINGSLEYYIKDGFDLIGQAVIDPTIGYRVGSRNAIVGNNAELKGHGFDAQIHFNKRFNNIIWNIHLLHSYNQDKITRYDFDNSVGSMLTPYNTPFVGKPRFSVFSLESAGLDPDNGDPRFMFEGKPSKAYANVLSLISKDDLIYHGPGLPTHFGSMLNSVKWKNIGVSFNISYKMGYWFRRNSVSYTDLFQNWNGHTDYSSRWKNPGDELNTNVPSLPSVGNNSMRDFVYSLSNTLVEKGDHVRLQDINISYEMTQGTNKWLPFSAMTIYAYTNNVGILSRSNKYNIDPDYNSYLFPPLKTYALGLKFKL